MRKKNTQVVLPTYTLDSNLVLLPGIIYNVTFSRFKAAALMYRFKDKVRLVSIINNLLNEFNFDSETHAQDDAPEKVSALPSTISPDATEGIASFNQQTLDSKGNSNSQFEWLVFAIDPNLDKIKEPTELSKLLVLSVVRVVGIVDDTTNIKLTLQAVARGLRTESSGELRDNEALVEVDLDAAVEHVRPAFKALRSKAYHLFDCIDDFVVEYRKALNTTESNKKDLLTLNPLANAFYLQLAGSKDFNKAYSSLQKLFALFSADDKSKGKIRSDAFLRLVDITGAVLPFPNHEKHKLLTLFDTAARIQKINSMVGDLTTVFENLKENNSFVNHWFHNEASNIQRASVVANQLKSMRIVLEGMTKKQPARSTALVRRDQGTDDAAGADNDDDDDDDDELRAITNFIKNKLPRITSLSQDSKRLIIKDYKRIKASLLSGGGGGGGGSDFHVIRNYLEIVMDIPWENYVTKFKSNREIDLVAAKAQLDADHYGLEHVKKRLIQYLVVLKLLGINAENAVSAQRRLEDLAKTKAANKSYDSSSIVIANDDETSSSHKNAQKKVQNSYTESSAQAALQVSKQNRSPIIMLAGPPGTGKTSLAKSIALSLGRNFQRISLGGVKDESEIRGHRRTYVGAMPGLIIQALRKARSMNPVILLDEVDKVVGGHSSARVNGDPSAALLEVLDPEQNLTFIDHYLGFPVDLSQVIFICTANEPHNMSRPLLDRMEMISVSAYDYNEKLVIGRKYLLPRQIRRNGFPEGTDVSIDEEVMKKIIVDYTREAGVRGFERQLGTICRFKAVEYCESLDSGNYDPNVYMSDLSKYLGIPFSLGDFTASETTISNGSRVGIVNGLSYNSDGSGLVLVFESIGFDKRVGNPGSSNSGCTLSMTGRLGEVLLESAKIALIFVKLLVHKGLLSLKEKDTQALLDKFSNLEINLHVPMGSILKDGPSAGITMALLFLSLILDKPVPHDVAMTGEITLRGLVLPIGGVKEKILGAHLNGGIKRIIVPRENRKDLIEDYSRSIEEAGTVDSQLLNELLRDNEDAEFKMTQVEDFYLNKYGIRLSYAREFYDVMKVVWDDEDVLLKLESNRMVEYHL